MQALISQQSKVVPTTRVFGDLKTNPSDNIIDPQMALYNIGRDNDQSFAEENNKDVKMNLQRMQKRVMELEKVCSEMSGQMSRLVRNNVFATPTHSKTLPRLC